MALDPRFVGRSYGPFTYTLGAEKMREFAYAVAGGIPSVGFGGPPAGLHPSLWSDEAARQGPHGRLIAFPTFAAAFAVAPFAAALVDPEIELNLPALVHGEQGFEFLEVMREGDVMTSTGTISQIFEKRGKDFFVVTTESRNQEGRLAVRATWTAVIRS